MPEKKQDKFVWIEWLERTLITQIKISRFNFFSVYLLMKTFLGQQSTYTLKISEIKIALFNELQNQFQ